MTLTDLIKKASRQGFMFDERAFRDTHQLTFVGVLDDGYSASRITFDSVGEASRYFDRDFEDR